jgi:hypothetical protein
MKHRFSCHFLNLKHNGLPRQALDHKLLKSLKSISFCRAKGLNVTVNGVGGIHPRDSPFSAFKVNIIGGMEMVERPIVYQRAIEMFAAIRGEIGPSAVSAQ